MSRCLQLRYVCSFGCNNRLIKQNVFVFTPEVQIIIVFLPVNEKLCSSIHVLWILLDGEVFSTENAPIQSDLFFKVLQFLLWRHRPNQAQAASFLRFIDHIQMHTPTRTPLNKCSARSYTTYIHAHSGIRIRDPSNQAVEHICLRPHGHRDRHNFHLSRRIIPRLNFTPAACKLLVWKGLYEPIV